MRIVYHTNRTHHQILYKSTYKQSNRQHRIGKLLLIHLSQDMTAELFQRAHDSGWCSATVAGPFTPSMPPVRKRTGRVLLV